MQEELIQISDSDRQAFQKSIDATSVVASLNGGEKGVGIFSKCRRQSSHVNSEGSNILIKDGPSIEINSSAIPRQSLDRVSILILIAGLAWLFACALVYRFGASVYRAPMPQDFSDNSMIAQNVADASIMMQKLYLQLDWIIIDDTLAKEAFVHKAVADCFEVLQNQSNFNVTIQQFQIFETGDKQRSRLQHSQNREFFDKPISLIVEVTPDRDMQELKSFKWIISKQGEAKIKLPSSLWLKRRNGKCDSTVKKSLEAIVEFLSTVSAQSSSVVLPENNASRVERAQASKDEHTISLQFAQLVLDAPVTFSSKAKNGTYNHGLKRHQHLLHSLSQALSPFFERLNSVYPVKVIESIRPEAALAPDALTAGLLPTSTNTTKIKFNPQDWYPYEIPSIDALPAAVGSNQEMLQSLPGIFQGLSHFENTSCKSMTNIISAGDPLRFIALRESILRPLAGSASWFANDALPSRDPTVNALILIPPLQPQELPLGQVPPFVAVAGSYHSQISDTKVPTTSDILTSRLLASELQCKANTSHEEGVMDYFEQVLLNNAMIISGWGTLVVLPWPLMPAHPGHVEKDDVNQSTRFFGPPLVKVLASQLRAYFGFPRVGNHTLSSHPLVSFRIDADPDFGIADWEKRLISFSVAKIQTQTAVTNLRGLHSLVERFSHMPIPDEVRNEVEIALTALKEYCLIVNQMAKIRSSEDQQKQNLTIEDLVSHARIALNASTKAFYHQDMLPQLYFPDEHLYAVYAPLIAPITVPLLGAIMKVISYVVSKKKK